MSHLHLPDGVLPWTVWAPAWLLAIAMLALAAWVSRHAAPQQIAYRGTLGALVLAAMTLTLPLGPFEYHLSLLGVLGVLAGPAGAYEALFVVSAILAFAGHGGLTVIGLNVLVLGAGAAIARPVHVALAPRIGLAKALAVAAAASQAVAGTVWSLVMLASLQRLPSEFGRGATLGWIAAAMALMWIVGVTVETLVALGLGRFLVRVKPDLLPGGARPPGEAFAGGAAA
jgi:cobalt/nickel transport system permease protein